MTRETILETALQILEESGLESLSMRALAKRLSLDAMTPYHYFRDKHALLGAAAELAYSKLEVKVRPHSDWKKRLEVLAVAYLALLARSGQLLRYLSAHSIESVVPARSFDQHFRHAVEALALPAGLYRTARNTFVDLVHGFSLAVGPSTKSPGPRQLLAELRVYLAGLQVLASRATTSSAAISSFRPAMTPLISRAMKTKLKSRKAAEQDLEKIKNEDIADCVDEDELRVVEGPITIEGSYDPSGKTLLVLGDLTVQGTLNVEETATLVVTGALRCQNLFLEGNLEVQGATEVTETIFGFYESGVSDLRGAVSAQLLLIGNHDLVVKKSKLTVKHRIDFDNFQKSKKLKEAAVRQVLTDEAFVLLSDLIGLTEDKSPETEKAQRLFGKKSWLRSQA